MFHIDSLAVTDRLAYLNFVQGSLANSLALKLDSARVQLKNLRDTEAAITPRRNIRAGLSTQISRIEHEQQKGYEKRLEDLRAQLKKHEDEDLDQEKQIEILKRKAIKESEQKKWDAIREVRYLIHIVFEPNSRCLTVWREACSSSTGGYAHYGCVASHTA